MDEMLHEWLLGYVSPDNDDYYIGADTREAAEKMAEHGAYKEVAIYKLVARGIAEIAWEEVDREPND